MKYLALASTLCAILFLAFVSPTLAYVSPGKPTGYVNDFARVLSPDTVQSLTSELSSFQETTSNEIAVVTISSLGGDYIEHYASQLFEEWGIGKKEKDNGILLLIAVEDHKLRIEVGYGLEGALPDSVAKRILETEMTPKLKARDYDGAVTVAVTAIEQAVKGEYTPARGTSSGFLDMPVEGIVTSLFFLLVVLQTIASIFARSKSWWAGGIVGILGGALVGMFLNFGLGEIVLLSTALGTTGALFDYLISNGYAVAKSSGRTPPWWTGGAGGFGGGSSGGGFGGGSSGGGGASGGW
jgi:uncharacterized protein